MADKKQNRLKLARVTLATVVFVAFILAFINIGGLFAKSLSFLPKLQFWPAVMAVNAGVLVLIVALTMIFGRLYCSVLCPLGILQDLLYRLKTLGKPVRKFRQSYIKPLNATRYSVLAAFILLTALGNGILAFLIEPYSIFGRMISSFSGKSLAVATASLVTFTLIVFLVVMWGRIWCNTICPVGSALSIFSRRSLFRINIDTDACAGCGLCGKACRASCIDTANHSVDMSRCVLCFDCIGNCKESAVKYEWSIRRNAAKAADNSDCTAADKASDKTAEKAVDKTAGNAGRRNFLAASAVLMAGIGARAKENKMKTIPLTPIVGREKPERNTPVVPPGAISIKHLDTHCVACQLCIQACPSKILEPSISFDRFMKPEMNFEKGFCRPECTKCSDVCPDNAIRKITPEEKTAISIGHAVFNPDRCVVLTDYVNCGNCARHCPAGAITLVSHGGDSGFIASDMLVPAVNTERCIGCGRCEYVCPARPVSAIYVEGNQMHREI